MAMPVGIKCLREKTPGESKSGCFVLAPALAYIVSAGESFQFAEREGFTILLQIIDFQYFM